MRLRASRDLGRQVGGWTAAGAWGAGRQMGGAGRGGAWHVGGVGWGVAGGWGEARQVGGVGCGRWAGRNSPQGKCIIYIIMC